MHNNLNRRRFIASLRHSVDHKRPQRDSDIPLEVTAAFTWPVLEGKRDPCLISLWTVVDFHEGVGPIIDHPWIQRPTCTLTY